MDFEYTTLKITVQDAIAWVQCDRPEKHNSLNREMLTELNQLLKELRNDEEVSILVITGSGEKAFVAGADIYELANYDMEQAHVFSQEVQHIFKTIETFPKPVIAAMNGYALGGGLELAMACHIRIASDNATMGLPETSLGIIPAFGGTQRLTNLVGKGKANELVLTAKMISAEQALKIGLINKIVPKKELLLETAKLSYEILKNSPIALSNAIQAINASQDRTKEGYKTESQLFADCFDTQEFQDRMADFFKRER